MITVPMNPNKRPKPTPATLDPTPESDAIARELAASLPTPSFAPSSLAPPAPEPSTTPPRKPSRQVLKMRALNKQQLRVISSGLEPGVEDLIMDKVLPAKRVAIEKFTDRADRPGFTDTNDPYTSCLREIDRRMKGTAFDNPVDDDDLKCRAIALVADQHDEILAAKDPAEREKMQLAIPQKVFDSFLRNKFPELRFLQSLPDKVRLPGGEIFTVNQSPADPARNPMIVGPDEEVEQDGLINAAIPTDPRGGQLPSLDADIQGGNESGPLERAILPDRRPDLSGTDALENTESVSPPEDRQALPPNRQATPETAEDTPNRTTQTRLSDAESAELSPSALEFLAAQESSTFRRLPFLNSTEVHRFDTAKLQSIADGFGFFEDFLLPTGEVALTAYGVTRAANAAAIVAKLSGPVAVATLTAGFAGVAGNMIFGAMAQKNRDEIRNLQAAYNLFSALKMPELALENSGTGSGSPTIRPFSAVFSENDTMQVFLSNIDEAAAMEYFESLKIQGLISENNGFTAGPNGVINLHESMGFGRDEGRDLTPVDLITLAFSEMNDFVEEINGQYIGLINTFLEEGIKLQIPSMGTVEYFQGLREIALRYRDSNTGNSGFSAENRESLALVLTLINARIPPQERR